MYVTTNVFFSLRRDSSSHATSSCSSSPERLHTRPDSWFPCPPESGLVQLVRVSPRRQSVTVDPFPLKKDNYNNSKNKKQTPPQKRKNYSRRLVHMATLRLGHMSLYPWHSGWRSWCDLVNNRYYYYLRVPDETLYMLDAQPVLFIDGIKFRDP